jgi:hypothetical protein
VGFRPLAFGAASFVAVSCLVLGVVYKSGGNCKRTETPLFFLGINARRRRTGVLAALFE